MDGFVEDERRMLDSKGEHFTMITTHNCEQVDEENIRVKVAVVADLDIILPHNEEYSDDYFPVSAAISRCLGLINPGNPGTPFYSGMRA